MPVGNRSSWSLRATKVTLGRFVGPVSDDWALSAQIPESFSHLRAPCMAEPLQSGPMVHQGSAAEQTVPTDGAVRGGGGHCRALHPTEQPCSPFRGSEGKLSSPAGCQGKTSRGGFCFSLGAAGWAFAKRFLKKK